MAFSAPPVRRKKPKAAKPKGAGSRGGHIIGTTRSGKPIYGPSHAHVSGARAGRNYLVHGASPVSLADKHVSDKHGDFTSRDHLDAAKVHEERAESPRISEYESYAHEDIARAHKDRGRQLAKGDLLVVTLNKAYSVKPRFAPSPWARKRDPFIKAVQGPGAKPVASPSPSPHAGIVRILEAGGSLHHKSSGVTVAPRGKGGFKVTETRTGAYTHHDTAEAAAAHAHSLSN